jgi:processive 1,2-diacylglycerol beta-glucosyltransferase
LAPFRVASARFGHHRAVPVSVPGFRRALAVLPARLRVLSDDRRRRPALLARYEARGGEPKLRIVVLTAEVGEGHAAAARALAADLVGERADVEVLICDALAGLGRFLRYVLLDAYRWQLRSAPWIFGLLYRLFARVPLFRGLGRAGLALFGARGLLRLIDRYRPDIVVSTFPAATSVLGYLRRRRRLTVPTCATATDLAGLEFWVHPRIDLHLVMHEMCVVSVERVTGVGSARHVQPLVARAFFAPCFREQARRELVLPLDKPVVVVSGGGWGVGDLAGAVRACLQLPAAVVVCLTGRNEPLQTQLSEAFAGEARVRVLGFTTQMSELLAASDALVHSTGGVTCLEALVRGCPIVAYGAPPGHARRTARVMTSLGLLQSADSLPQLVAALGRALAQPAAERPRLAPAPSAGSLILAAEPRLWPTRPRRARLLRPAATAATVFALVGWMFLSDDAYPVAARMLDLAPIASITTGRPVVGLVIRAPARRVDDLVNVLGRSEEHASFAFAAAPERRTLRALTVAGDQPLPELRPGELTRWLDTKDELKHEAQALGLPNRSFYLAPASGFTASQYLLGRDVGAAPIVGSVRIDPDRYGAARTFHGGDIIVLTLGSEPQTATKALDQLLADLARQGLAAVTFGELVASKR